MNLEILEFYPAEKDDKKQTLSGTIRIRLIDFEIEILGIYVSKQQDRWYFNLPSRKGTHHETGAPVRYPNFVFTDRDKHRQFIDAIREKGKTFIECRLLDTDKPLIFPQKQKKELRQSETHKAQNKPTELKETISTAKPKQKVKEFYDLPPRSAKSTATYVSKFAQR